MGNLEISVVIRITQGSSKVSHTCFKSSRSRRNRIGCDPFMQQLIIVNHSRLLSVRERLSGCAPPTPMSSNPAVAEPAAQVPLRHARDEVYRCTMFGTRQAWKIPEALRGGPRSSDAFKSWYMAQRRVTSQSLAARGNIQACKSIKETKDRSRLRSRLYMKRCRDRQRVVAQRIALGRKAAPWVEWGGEIVD